MPLTFFTVVMAIEFGFKELLWDAGWIWLILLMMLIAWIFNIINEYIKIGKEWAKKSKSK